MLAEARLDQSKAELEAVISSGIFAKAPSLALLLDYVCTKYFDGQANQIKEYNIAVEALGRPATFDPRQDSIVRVEAFRLRKRLKQYYENGGASRPLRIVIPSGQYVPQFVENSANHPNGVAVIEEPPAQRASPPALDPESAVTPDPLPIAQPVPEVSRRWPFWVRFAAVIGLPLALGLIALAGWYTRVHANGKSAVPATIASVPLAETGAEIRILAGSTAARYVDHAGNVWSGDRYFRGGSAFGVPGHVIMGTPDPEIFRSRREGEFSYDIPLKPGTYELHLYFAETLFGENNTAGGGESSRVFRVSINDKPVLWTFDVIADANGNNMADERVFKDVSPAPDGKLHIQFVELFKELPFLNAIEILPGIPGKIRPIRIEAGPRGHTDRRGLVWGPDRYYRHGTIVTRSEPVTNTQDPALFESERFGNFTYAIPVAPGRYTVTMEFAETWFGPGSPGGGGAGSRVFDVYCNGAALLRAFDIFRAAGGSQRALEKTFHGVSPNAQGKIVLSFVPVINYASVNAVDVEDESN